MRLINDTCLTDLKSRILSLILALSLSSPVIAQGDGSNLKISNSQKNYKYGYVDQNNNVVISYQYQRAYDFYNGKAIVQKNDKYGIIDAKGKTVYPFSYSNIKLYKDQGVYVVNTGKANGTGAIDLDLKPLIPFEYSYINPAGDVLIVIKINDKYEYVSGAFSKTGRLILPATINGELKDNGNGYITTWGEGKGGLLKITGELIIPFEHRKVEVNVSDNYVSVSDSCYTYYIYNFLGQKVSDIAYDYFRPLKDGYFTVNDKGKWGIIREKGISIPCIYDDPDTDCYSGTSFLLSRDKKYGVLDTLGKEIIPFIYDKVIRYPESLYMVTSNSKSGILNSYGKVIVPCAFANIPAQPANRGFILEDDRKKFGAIDIEGNQIVPFIIDEEYVKNNFKTAEQYLAKMLEIDPKNPYVIYYDALGWYTTLKPADALPKLTRHVDKFGYNTYAPHSLLYLRAKAYTDLNNFEAAANDAMWANSSIWGSKAYIYMGDKKFLEKDYKAAEHYYLYAGLYTNEEEASQYRNKAIEELKKRGEWVERKIVLQDPEPPVPDLPVTILNFTTEDKMEYVDWDFKYLYTYDEAQKECPPGYRLPELKDWVKLIEYIMRDKNLTQSQAYMIRDYIGEGWDTEYYIEKVMRTEHLVFRSQDEYGLNISPLRRSSFVRDMSDYMKSHDVIRYWCVPGEINGKRANMIEFSIGGFDWIDAEDNSGTACVRYIKK